jgi:hypothetical protein
VPDYTEDERKFLKEGSKRSGRFTATQTKARQLAEERLKRRRTQSMIKASKDSDSFEDYIRGKGSQ